VIVDVPLAPAFTVMDVGFIESAKLCGIVYVALATALFDMPAPVAIASIVSVDETMMGPLYTVELVVGVVPFVV
jgi:hypothetical protein